MNAVELAWPEICAALQEIAGEDGPGAALMIEALADALRARGHLVPTSTEDMSERDTQRRDADLGDVLDTDSCFDPPKKRTR